MPHLADLAPRNEALARAKAQEESLDRAKPGFFGQLFGGQDDPRLSGDQNVDARRGALRQGGFAGLLAAGQGRNILSTVGAIGTAASKFREEHNEQVGAANLELSKTLAPSTQLTELIVDGVKHRVIVDKKTGRLIADLGPSELMKMNDLRTPIKIKLVNGDEVFAFVDVLNGQFIDPNTGERLFGEPVPATPNLQIRSYLDRATGETHEVLFDPKTGIDLPGSDRLVELAEGGEGDDLALAGTISRHIDTMERIMWNRNFRMFGVLPSWAVNVGILRQFTTAQLQMFNAASKDILSLVTKSRSGAQASEQEVRRLEAFAIPLPGDHAETIRFKFQLMRNIANDLRGGKDPYERIRDGSGGLKDLPFDPETGKMLAPSNIDLGIFSDIVPKKE